MIESFRFLKPYVKLNRKKFVLAFIFLLLGLLSFAIMPEILKDVVNSSYGHEDVRMTFLKGSGSLKKGAALAVLLAIMHLVFQYLAGLFLARGAEDTIWNLRCRIYSHLSCAKACWFDAQEAGELVARCTTDVEVIRKFISTEMLKVLKISLQIVVSAVLLCRINMRVSAVAFAAIPVILGGSYWYYKKVSYYFKKADEAEAELLRRAEKNIVSVKAVRAYGMEKKEIAEFEEKNSAYIALWRKIGKIHSYYFSVSNFLTGLEVFLVLLIGCCEAAAGRMNLGDYMAVFAYNGTLIWPVKELGRTLAAMGQAEVSIGRIRYILDAPAEEEETGGLTPDLSGDIEFRNVSFSYSGRENILKNFSCVIPGGKKTAFLGETGSGKSTLFLLLMRFYSPDEGEIFIGGVNIEEISRSYLRKNIGFVLQEPYLYAGTIKDNLFMAEKNTDDRHMEKACKMACIHKNIKSMPKGYDTEVGEKGRTLSGGQRQRVAMAQIFLKQTPVLLLDDALSAVDAETDRQIRHVLKRDCLDVTVAMITHRAIQSQSADKIIYIRDGSVICSGTPEELLAYDNPYRNLIGIQKGEI